MTGAKPEKPKVVREAVRAYPAVDADGFDAKAFFTPEGIAEIEVARKSIERDGGLTMDEVEGHMEEMKREWRARNGA